MPRKSEKDRVDLWHRRITPANKIYKDWEEKFKCELLWQYYQGFQWGEDTDKYTINLVFPTIQTQLPSLLFSTPKAIVKARPQRIDDPESNADKRAQLREDTINAILPQESVGFEAEHSLGLLDHYFRFGVVELGYTADFMDNPQAGKPILKEEPDGEKVPLDSKVITSESVFFKRIAPETFRVSSRNTNKLERCDWCGYFEWHYISDVKSNRNYKNTSKLKVGGTQKDSAMTDESAEDKEQHHDMIRVWKIWDIRDKKKLIFSDSGDKFFLEQDLEVRSDGSPIIPFSILKPVERPGEFYPIPPVFNWISPQDELNETREMQRLHRKRFKRKFQAMVGSISTEEKEKWALGDDGHLVETLKPDAIQPIKDAPLDPSVVRNIPQSREDFMEIAAVGGDQRGIPESETATQANIIDTRTKIREVAARGKVGAWVARSAKLMMETIERVTTLPFWIQINVDPFSPNAPIEAQEIATTWQEIQRSELGVLDYDVEINIESMTPITEASERNSWTQVLGIITNPQVFMVLSASDTLLRKTLGFYGIRNDKEINEIKKIGNLLLKLQMQQAQGQPGQKAASPQVSEATGQPQGVTLNG